MTRFRVARIPGSRLAGSSLIARPGHFSFERGGALLIAIATIVLGSATAALSGAWVTSLACGLLLVVGLPHGALDIATIRRAAPTAQRTVVAAYLGAAAAMLAVWWLSPLAGLAAFYTVSIAHFADDWDKHSQPFFGYAIALALLSAPTFFHADGLRDLFVALTNDPRAALLVDLLILAAPVASSVALIGLAALGAGRRSAEGFCALAAMLVLPPVIGFAVFFCLFHSPRHFREGWAALGANVRPGTSMQIAAMTMAGFGIAASIYAANTFRGAPAGLFEASMMTLSALTVPHMLLATILERAAAKLYRRSGQTQRGPVKEYSAA